MKFPVCTIYFKGNKYSLKYEGWPIFKFELTNLKTGETKLFDTHDEANEAVERREI